MRETEMEPGYYEEEGLGMAGNSYKHQNIISRLSNNIVKRFPELEGHLRSETNVIDIEGTKGKRYPDITIWQTEPGDIDAEPENLLMIIEITNSAYFDEKALRCINDAYAKHPEMQEAFIYNYTNKTWERYTYNKKSGLIEENCDFSEYLQANLNDILYNNVYNLKNNSFIKYDVYDYSNYKNFDQEGLEIISKIRERLVSELPEKELNIRDDIKLSNHLIGNGVYMPVVSFWKLAKLQGENCFLDDMCLLIEVASTKTEAYELAETSFDKSKCLREVLVYSLISEEWTCYTKNIRKGIIEEFSDGESVVLGINMYDVVGMV